MQTKIICDSFQSNVRQKVRNNFRPVFRLVSKMQQNFTPFSCCLSKRKLSQIDVKQSLTFITIAQIAHPKCMSLFNWQFSSLNYTFTPRAGAVGITSVGIVCYVNISSAMHYCQAQTTCAHHGEHVTTRRY